MRTTNKVSETPGTDRCLTRKQAAVMTGYSEKTLANLGTLRKGPPYRKYRGHCMYLESELLGWLKSMPVQGGGSVATA